MMVTNKNNIKGVCMICGCTDNNACMHPLFGACWWINDNQNLCSHCVELKDDPDVIIAKGNSESRVIRTKEMFYKTVLKHSDRIINQIFGSKSQEDSNL